MTTWRDYPPNQVVPPDACEPFATTFEAHLQSNESDDVLRPGTKTSAPLGDKPQTAACTANAPM